MRVLCTCLPGYGHVHPMVPLARALQAAGHEVAFATEARFCPRVERAGFRAFPAGIGPGLVLARTVGAGPPGDPATLGARMFAGVAAPAKVPDLVMAKFGAAYLDICPPALQSPDLAATGAHVLPLRPVPFDAVAGEALSPWAEARPAGPTVYVTLGTLDNDAPGVLEAVVAGLVDEPVNVVVTVGPDRDPAELGPHPAHVHVERYVPQSLLLPQCHTVVCHGGSGTTLAALAHGLPLVLLPQGANQFDNAVRAVAAGVAIRLLPHEIDAGAVRLAVRAVLGEPAFRRRAGDVAAEIAAMPAPADLVAPLVEIARGGDPRR